MRTRELTKLSGLFEKYKRILIAPEASVINAFIEVVEDLYELKLKKEQLRYNPTQKTLSFSGPGALRNELKMHETEIIAHLKGRLGEKSAPKRLV